MKILLYKQVFDVIKIDQVSDDIYKFQINYHFFCAAKCVRFPSYPPPLSGIYGIKDANHKLKNTVYTKDIQWWE